MCFGTYYIFLRKVAVRETLNTQNGNTERTTPVPIKDATFDISFVSWKLESSTAAQ